MATLQKLDIMLLAKLKTEAVTIDGDDIIVSELGAADGYKLFNNPQYQDKDGNLDMSTFGPALLAMTIVDDNGARIFSDDDSAGLSRIPTDLNNRLLGAALRLNGLSAAQQETEIKN